jgi:cardiolipin synthase
VERGRYSFLRSERYSAGTQNLRNHRKMLIVDAGRESARLWCGGRNLGVEYFDGQKDSQPWRDLSFDLRGDVVAQAAALFEHDWTFTTTTT